MPMPDVFEQLWDSPTAYLLIPLQTPQQLAQRYGITLRQAQSAIELAKRIATDKKIQKQNQEHK